MPPDHAVKIQPYKTILRLAQDEYIVQKSRFLTQAMPVNTEEDALAFIRGIRQQHPQASHNCYAYIIGANSGLMRYSDDGEPSGTAGQPIMSVLQAKDLVDICVVVTRYFGGVLLGAGGLVRAYSTSCARAVDQSTVIQMDVTYRLTMDIPYTLWDRLQHYIKNQQQAVQLETVDYGASVNAQILIKEQNLAKVQKEIVDLLNRDEGITLSNPFIHYWPIAAAGHTF